MAKHEVIKTVITKAWTDIERKVYAFLIGGGVPAAVFAVLAYAGVDTSVLPAWLPLAITWLAGTVAGYLTPNVVKIPVDAAEAQGETPVDDPEIDASV